VVARPTVLIDTCVLINLLASGVINEVLGAAGHVFAICTAVEGKSLYLLSDDLESPTPEEIRLNDHITPGVLSLCQIESEEEELLYVYYASQLEDGEAMSLALAEARGYTLATDDRKARRMFAEAVGEAERLLSTSDLIRGWGEREALPKPRLKETLLRINRRARFVPPRTDPNHEWWWEACI
jgi:predicted nucleic acid-binding protein